MPSAEIIFLGDVYLPRALKIAVPLPGEIIFNLESPITASESATAGKICLKAPRSFILETFGRRPLAVCLANNHIMDYGPQGLDDTLAALRADTIPCFGAGTLDEHCRNPLIVQVAGQSVGLLGYVCPSTSPIFATPDHPGVMPIDLPRIRADIAALKRQAVHRIVVVLHWGEEQVHLPKPADVRLAQQIIEAGADLLISHHSHTVQAVQVHQGKTICYGLGNCMFPDFEVPIVEPAGRRMFRSAQKSWNRRSLAVTLDVPSGRVSMQGLRFNGETLESASVKPRVLPSLDAAGTQLPRYERRYARHAFACNARELAARFIDKPKLPRLQHIRALLGSRNDGSRSDRATEAGGRSGRLVAP